MKLLYSYGWYRTRLRKSSWSQERFQLSFNHLAAFYQTPFSPDWSHLYELAIGLRLCALPHLREVVRVKAMSPLGPLAPRLTDLALALSLLVQKGIKDRLLFVLA